MKPAQCLSAFALTVLAASFNVGCVSKAAYDELLSAHQNLRRVHGDMESNYGELERRAKTAEDQLAQKDLELDRYMSEANLATDKMADIRTRIQDLEGKRKAVAMTEGVEVFDTPEGTVVRISDEILFDSGSDELKSRAREALKKVADLVAEGSDPVQVEGHTDSDPVVKTKDRWPLGNLQLSAARALAVANFLMKEGKVRNDRVSVTGYGEFRPIVANDSKSNKARNRRVEVKILETNVQ